MFFDPQCKPENELARVFLGAANLIEQRGWCQNIGEGPDGICVARALELVSPSVVIFSIAIRRLAELVGTRYANLWNDVPGRTKGEVVAILRKAATL